MKRYNPREMFNPPIIVWIGVVLCSMGIFFSVNFFMMIYDWYSWWTVPFYLFPFVQIIRSLMMGNRNVFKVYYQLLYWIQTLLIPMMLRGYEDNFLSVRSDQTVNLIVLPSIVGGSVLLQISQNFWGPRWFCACFFPKPHSYFVK